ncbi:MAG: glycosyltransferase family 2 protein [Candidatus Aminicenantes bacterium]|nr:glycosyltransferase family 2 protein [Candidatus Aminicenantes bacterium]
MGQSVSISIVIPTYNRAGFLKEAIESVLKQDYFHDKDPSWEFYVIDDGSQDETRRVVESFGEKVNYYYQENRGISRARNQGIELSQGEYIAFLDSDDLWKKEKLRLQIEFMEAHPDAQICCTQETWIRKGVFVNQKKKHKKFSGEIFDKVLPLCILSLSSALFRKSLFVEIGVFDENLPACEDYDLSIRIAHKYPIFFLPQSLIIKRGGHLDQLSRKYWGMDRFRVTALQKAREELELTPPQKELVEKELVKKCRVLVNGFLKRGKIKESKPYIELISRYGKEIIEDEFMSPIKRISSFDEPL